MILKIDQAGKIEQTEKDTILAFSSEEIQYTIKIPKKIKQDIFSKCKKQHKKQIMLKMFSWGLYLLLKNKINENTLIFIDEEYPQKDRYIKNMLAGYLKINADRIRFDKLGKEDISHKLANNTFSGKLKPNEVITKDQLNISLLYTKKQLEKLQK